MDARAIKSALELGLVDALIVQGASSLTTLSAERKIIPGDWRC